MSIQPGRTDPPAWPLGRAGPAGEPERTQGPAPEGARMPFGDTAKSIQKVATTAENVYERINEVGDRLIETQEAVAETRTQVERLEAELAEQRAILDALAESEGLDLDSITAEAHIDEAERPGEATDERSTGAPGRSAGDDPQAAPDGE